MVKNTFLLQTIIRAFIRFVWEWFLCSFLFHNQWYKSCGYSNIFPRNFVHGKTYERAQWVRSVVYSKCTSRPILLIRSIVFSFRFYRSMAPVPHSLCWATISVILIFHLQFYFHCLNGASSYSKLNFYYKWMQCNNCDIDVWAEHCVYVHTQ